MSCSGYRAAQTGGGESRGSAVGAVYRHLTPEEMQARVLAAVDGCLAVAIKALAARCDPRRPPPVQPMVKGWPRSKRPGVWWWS
jgi:hypothetical protein